MMMPSVGNGEVWCGGHRAGGRGIGTHGHGDGSFWKARCGQLNVFNDMVVFTIDTGRKPFHFARFLSGKTFQRDDSGRIAILGLYTSGRCVRSPYPCEVGANSCS